MREEGELTEACHLGEEEITNQVNQAVSLSNGGSQQWKELHWFHCQIFTILSSAKATYAAIAETYSYLTPDL